MLRIGIRELKTSLSKYLEQIKQGQTLIITEHGKPIGRIVPEAAFIAQRLQDLKSSGILFQVGNTLPVISPVVVSLEDHSISDLVSKGRDIGQ